MNKIRIIVFLLLLTGLFNTMLKAQDDFGGLAEVSVTKKIYKGLSATLEEEFRMRDKFNEIDRFSSTLDLSYKFNNYIKIGGAYSLIRHNHKTKGWETRNRYYFYATGSYKVQRFTFSLRERFQSTHRVGISETTKRANPKLYLRSRLEVEYDIRKSPFEPFVSAEIFNTLNDPQENSIERVRYTAGCLYKLNKQHRLRLFYRYNDYSDDDENSIHIIGLGYSFKF